MFLLILKAHSQIHIKGLNSSTFWDYKKQKCLIRRAKPGDGNSLGPRLRNVDLKEIEAYSKEPPEDQLEDAIKIYGAHTYALEFEGLVIALFGVVPYSEFAGIIWLVGSDDILKIKIPFLRNCRLWLEAFSELYPILFNVVSKANDLHITWLKWMGFIFINEQKEYGLNKEPFIEFVKIRK